MEKLLTNLILAVLLNAFTSAAPTDCTTSMKLSTVSQMEVAAGNSIPPVEETEFEIHPLDILTFKFK